MKIIAFILSTAALATLVGCVAPTPNLDAHYGVALEQDCALQTLDPEATMRPAPPPKLEASAAHATMQRYLKSFQTPPPSGNVFTIGVGSAGTSP